MHLVYVDDSKDEKHVCFSAIIIPAARWLEAFNYLVAVRREMKKSHGIYTRLELHATDWLGGRGNVAPQTVRRIDRAYLFNYVLDRIVELPEVKMLNAHSVRANEDELFKRLMQRIEQAADFCAYSLLRFEGPTERAVKMGFDQSFLRLENTFIKQAFGADPRKLGIIRV